MESFIKEQIDFFQDIYIKTLNPVCLEILENLKGLSYERKDSKESKADSFVVKWC